MKKIFKNEYISPKEKEILNEYNPSKSKYSTGNKELYRENIYFIRQYPQFLKIVRDELSDKIADSGYSKGYIEARKRIELIERAFGTIPYCYREGVLNHIVNQVVYTDPQYDYANIKTWKYWTQKVVYEVAIRRGQKELIEIIKKREKDE